MLVVALYYIVAARVARAAFVCGQTLTHITTQNTHCTLQLQRATVYVGVVGEGERNDRFSANGFGSVRVALSSPQKPHGCLTFTVVYCARARARIIQ